ncbi:metalloprotease MEP1 [Metarhizium brunneum]
MLYHLTVASLSLLARASLATTIPTNALIPALDKEFVDLSQPSEELLSIHQQLNREKFSPRSEFPLTVDVYLNIITSTNEGQDAVKNTTITWMLDTLNNAYKPGQITFQLQDTARIINSTWAANEDDENMRSILHKGDKSTLNLYLVEALIDWIGGGNRDTIIIGSTTSPDELRFKNRLSQDGVLLNIGTLPGGSFPGKTTTCIHEVGHWFGLLHTFQGGCAGGDGVDDTPAQANPSYDCNKPRDSCPNDPGMDPIKNFMDYGSDDCRSEFTPGQMKRIKELWNKFRDPAVTLVLEEDFLYQIRRIFNRIRYLPSLQLAFTDDATLKWQLLTQLLAAQKDLTDNIGKPDFGTRVKQHFAGFRAIRNVEFSMDKDETLKLELPLQFKEAEEGLLKMA